MKKSQFETLIREVIRETIRKVDGRYVVYPEKGGKRLGTHSTKVAAEKQLTAIHLNKEDIREAFKKGKVIIYHNFQGVDVDENVPGTNKVLNIADCIGNEPAKDYNYFTTEKKQYVEDMIKDASGEGWKKFPPVLAIPHPIVSGKYSVIDGNHRLGAFTMGKLPQINARILSEDKIELAERGAEWDENKLPKTLPLADAKKQGVNLKEYFATQPLKVPSNENYADGKVKKIVDDILSGLNEGTLSGVVDKMKHYAKKGLLTLAIVSLVTQGLQAQGLPQNDIDAINQQGIELVQQTASSVDRISERLIVQHLGQEKFDNLVKLAKENGLTLAAGVSSNLSIAQQTAQVRSKSGINGTVTSRTIDSKTMKTSDGQYLVIQFIKITLQENYADGKVRGKSRPGRVKKAGASCKGSVTDLRAKAKKYGGEKGKMYHWCANMKGGKK